jgi:hypothetical protein
MLFQGTTAILSENIPKSLNAVSGIAEIPSIEAYDIYSNNCARGISAIHFINQKPQLS